jgi:hypothetical protein
MKNNPSLRTFLMITGMFFLLMIGGSIVNFTLSVVFMETFYNIQCSPIWVLHTIIILILTVSTGLDMEKEQ